MNSRGVRPVRARSRAEIERLADKLVERYYPERASQPGPVPIQHFYEIVLPRDFKIDTGTAEGLRPTVHGVMLPAGRQGRPEVVLDFEDYLLLCEDHPQARVYAGHEAGHGILHAKELRHQLTDGKIPALHRRANIPRYLDPEWQAHVFAGTFLIPSRALEALIRECGADANEVKRTFRVSFTVAQTRLYYFLKGGHGRAA